MRLFGNQESLLCVAIDNKLDFLRCQFMTIPFLAIKSTILIHAHHISL